MDVVTIATYAKPEEAHLARLRLCREGIDAYVVDEAMVQMNWSVGFMIGGVRLQVAEGDIESALGILKAEPVVLEGPDAAGSCPRCSSHKVDVYFNARMLGLVSWILKVPLLFFTRWHRWQCSECGHTWK